MIKLINYENFYYAISHMINTRTISKHVKTKISIIVEYELKSNFTPFLPKVSHPKKEKVIY